MHKIAVFTLASFLSATAAGLCADNTAYVGASPTYVGPDGWHHQQSKDTVRTVDTWNFGDGAMGQTVTFMRDTSTAYADMVATMARNFSENNVKLDVDKNFTCAGRPSHFIQYSVGPDGHQIIINRAVITDGTGVIALTYTRGQAMDYDPDVKKSITSYCGTFPN